jgi:hypothetical protein
MSTTRATLRTRVLANLEGRTDTAMVTAVDAGLDEACEVLSAWEWREMSARTDAFVTRGYRGAWVSGTAYVVGDVVLSTTYWRCLTANSAGTPAEGANWTASSLAEVAYVSVSGLGELYRVQVIDGTSSYTIEIRTKLAVEDGTPVAETQAAGKPVACYREGDLIYFTPVPDAVYALRVHYRKILTLASGTSATLSLDGFDSLVCAYATGYAYLSVRHAPKHAAEWTGKFQQLVALKRQGLGHNGVAEGMDLRCSPADGAGYYDQTQRGIDPLVVRFRGGAS